MKRYLAPCLATALVLGAVPALAQQKATITGVPEIPVTSVPNFLKVPAVEYLGESVAVATNSKGHIFVYYRSAPTSKLWEFDQNGSFLRETGRCYYGVEFSQSLCIDP